MANCCWSPVTESIRVVLPVRTDQAVGAAGEALLADEEDDEGRGQGLGEDGEVGAAHPPAEHQGSQQGGHTHGDEHGRGDGEPRVGERFPEQGRLSTPLHDMKSGTLLAPTSASLRCMAMA